MEVNNDSKSIYIKADSGKVLKHKGQTFSCAYMPLDTNISEIEEVEEIDEEQIES